MNAIDRIGAVNADPVCDSNVAFAPARAGAWHAADAAHPEFASLFGSSTWMDVLEATYGFEIETAIVKRDGVVSAALPFADIDDIRGRRIVSLPFSDFVDPLVGNLSDWNRLIAPVLERGAPVRLRVLHNTPATEDTRFARKSAVLWHAADLSGNRDELWARLDPAARQNIRRAERNGLTVTAGRTLKDVETFYDLHLHVRKSKYRLLAQPFSFFANIHDAFSRDDRIVTLLAKQNGEPVAGILFLIDRGSLYYKFNASGDARYRPNDLLVWHGMQLGRERGLSLLDFGISDIDQPGLVRFKRKFATAEKPVFDLRWSPPGKAADNGEIDRMLQELTTALTDPAKPDAMTRAAADEFYRLFS